MLKYTEIHRKSTICYIHAMSSCPLAAFALILVGYIVVPYFTVCESHFVIFPVNCHAEQEEEAKIEVAPSSCMRRNDWTK